MKRQDAKIGDRVVCRDGRAIMVAKGKMGTMDLVNTKLTSLEKRIAAYCDRELGR